MPDYTPNFSGVIDALKTIIQVGIAGGSGGGGGSATSANQDTQTARLEAIRDRLPLALVGDRLKVDLLASQLNIASVKDYVSSSIISTTNLAASAIFNSGVQTTSGNKIRGWVVTNQTGTLYVEQSHNATNWRNVSIGTTCNNGATGFEYLLYSNYYRFVYINGATAQGSFELVATQFGIGA